MSQAKLIFMAAVAAMQYAATSALAQITSAGAGAVYPAKSVRVIAGFPPASGADITARVVGAKLYELMGQQFLVENGPGAGSNIVGNQGIEVLGGTPERFADYIRDEIAKWAKVIRRSGARAD
jgi:tripartite-type tricarboxylate transporter receptor subunit TctC